MKRFLLIAATIFFSQNILAEHITGGEMYYTYMGRSGTDYQYRITLKLYRDCFSAGADLDNSAAIGIFSRGSNTMVWNERINISRRERLQLGTPGPCISGDPQVCYEVGYYEFTVALPGTVDGYTVSYQRCCRINGITNLVASGSVGATYTAIIPGTNSGSTAPANNSARFTGKDTVIVCGGYPFTYSFAAQDSDPGDQLRYSFCAAYPGGGPSTGGGSGNASPDPPAAPPYSGVTYRAPFNSSAPMGPGVTINPTTGLITGRSPAQGIYVVTVCVQEIRNGVVIATQRKDVQIKAEGCDIATPQLDPEYITCDGFNYDFTQASNPLVNTYNWEFGDPASGANNFSTLQNPSHVFSTAGEFIVKLVVNRGQDCSDSATTRVKVYPGFFPAFTNVGICLRNPVQFLDQTTTNYGVVNSWSWDFGDAAGGDIADTRNPTWQYTSEGTKTVRLIVGSDLGCVDTLQQDIRVIEKPPITLAFADTLICVPDNLQLQASGTGNFSWTPTAGMANPNTGTPTVAPSTTTKYYVTLDEQGCTNTDSVQVRVVTFVTLAAMPDTTICLTDQAQLFAASDGLRYEWTPTATIIDPTVRNPIAIPVDPVTNYQVIARIGSCSSTDNVIINTVPYPIANAGLDTTICYNTAAFLQGSHDGNSFTWSPVSSLLNANTLTPTAFPARTAEYVLTSLDNRGCPKPGRDTVLVTVLPRIVPFAGRDTLVVVGQPLQFNAEGGVSYNWTPVTGLNNPTIKNPIGVYGPEIDSIQYTVEVFNEIGCSDSAYIRVVVFKTNPYVFVPTAFTPNGDGLNDVIRPIAVGVQKINYFRIFNRWGEAVFSTTINEFGWDGKIKGVLQASNVYVWMVSAVDYTGKTIFLKGTTTLIR